MTKLTLVSRAAPCIKFVGNPRVYGAGGWKIFQHFGVEDECNLQGIVAGVRLGVSAGAVSATFFANGHSVAVAMEPFLKIVRSGVDMGTIFGALRLADPITMAYGGGFSLRNFFENLVNEYDLKFTDDLKILTCDLTSREPVVLTNKNCRSLVVALVAATAVPGLFQPEWLFVDGRWRVLGDGALYHYSPTEFTEGPAIVSKFKPASQFPRDWRSLFGLVNDYQPGDEIPDSMLSLMNRYGFTKVEDFVQFWRTMIGAYMTAREIFFPFAGNNRYVDPEKHLVIESGLPDVAALSPDIDEKKCLEMVEDGRKEARAAILKAKDEGRFCECD